MGLFADGFKELIRKLNILAFMGYNFQWKLVNQKKNIYNID